jgi:hypothetical protein
LTLIALGATLGARFSLRRPVFLLNHLGLWLVLLAAGLGAADRQREIMRVPEGGIEWRSSRAGEIKELDLAIRLDDFVMEEHPARLALVDPASGRVLPSPERPEFFQIDPRSPSGRLGPFMIEVLEFLPLAAPAGQGGFARSVMNGSIQAARVRATASASASGEVFSGWLSAGGDLLPPSPLLLGSGDPGAARGPALVMVRPEPKSFLSKVKVFTAEGLELESQVSVNHPLRAGDWLIYQYDYDSAAGPGSSWSGFELVKDPWLHLAYAGFAVLSLGCLGLAFSGRT